MRCVLVLSALSGIHIVVGGHALNMARHSEVVSVPTLQVAYLLYCVGTSYFSPRLKGIVIAKIFQHHEIA